MPTATATETVETTLPEIRFAAGLPGFPDARRFALVQVDDAQDSPFFVLRSLEDADLEFVVVPPVVFFPDYAPELDDDTVDRLGITSAEDVLALVMVTLGANPAEATANLLAPLVINRHTLDAVQTVLVASGYDVRAPLIRQ